MSVAAPRVSTPRGGSRWSSGIAWLLVGLATIILVMTALRDVWPVLDVASPLALHAVALMGVAMIALVLRFGRGLFLFSGLGLIVIAPSLLTLDARESPGDVRLPWHQASAFRDSVPTLRLLSINTWHANESLDRLRAYVAQADADVVVLSEFGANKLELLRQLRPIYPYQVNCAEAWPCSQVLISRVPFVRSGTRMPSLSNPPLVWAEFRLGGQMAHKFTVFGTHICRPSRRYDWHTKQLEGLARIVQRTDGAVVVAGDFNMTRLSQSFSGFADAAGLSSPARVLASWPAWPLPLPQVQLDHVFVSPDLQVLEQRIGPMVGSDHLPVWSAIRLPDRATQIATDARAVERVPERTR